MADDAAAVAAMLVEVGLAEEQDYGYLRLDPALSTYLQLEQIPEQLTQLTNTWVAVMVALVDLLYEEMKKDGKYDHYR